MWLGEEGLTKIKHEAVCNPACTRAPRSAERHEWEICLFCFIQIMHLLRLLEVIKQREIVKAHITDCNIFHLNPYRTSITRDDDGLLEKGSIKYLPELHKGSWKVVSGDQTSPEKLRQYHSITVMKPHHHCHTLLCLWHVHHRTSAGSYKVWSIGIHHRSLGLGSQKIWNLHLFMLQTLLLAIVLYLIYNKALQLI